MSTEYSCGCIVHVRLGKLRNCPNHPMPNAQTLSGKRIVGNLPVPFGKVVRTY